MGHTESVNELLYYLIDNKKYSEKWESDSCNNKYVQHVLDNASKKGTGNIGKPDLIYCNENNRLLILLENKPNIKLHTSGGGRRKL